LITKTKEDSDAYPISLTQTILSVSKAQTQRAIHQGESQAAGIKDLGCVTGSGTKRGTKLPETGGGANDCVSLAEVFAGIKPEGVEN